MSESMFWQPLYLRYETLIIAQKKAGLYEDAMKTTAALVLTDQSCLTIACENWATVKQSIIKNNGLGDKLLKR